MNIGDYLIHQPTGTVWIVRKVVLPGECEIDLVGSNEKKRLPLGDWIGNLPDGWEIASLPAATKIEFDKLLNPKP